MNELERFLLTVRDAFDDQHVEHMVVGSMAANWLGLTRTTNDVDVIISTTRPQLIALARKLKAAGLYIDEECALDALHRQSMINAIQPETGWKIDLIVLNDKPFSRAEFDRRFDHETTVGTFSTQTAEDLILSKLVWGRDAESERQFRDVGGVFDIWRSKLDVDYLHRWSGELGVRDLLGPLFDRPTLG